MRVCEIILRHFPWSHLHPLLPLACASYARYVCVDSRTDPQVMENTKFYNDALTTLPPNEGGIEIGVFDLICTSYNTAFLL